MTDKIPEYVLEFQRDEEFRLLTITFVRDNKPIANMNLSYSILNQFFPNIELFKEKLVGP